VPGREGRPSGVGLTVVPQRVLSILSTHGVRFCLDRAHAKGHTCSCIYFPDESLAVTNGVSTQAAEVQHSVSVKFRGHLAYMSPTAFMAHCIAQISMMNLTASYKVHHPKAKAENEDRRLNGYYYEFRNAKCLRPYYPCPASVLGASSEPQSGQSGGSASAAAGGRVESGEGERGGSPAEAQSDAGGRSSAEGDDEGEDSGTASTRETDSDASTRA